MRNILTQKPGGFVRQFSIMLDNRVGALTALLGLLESRGIICLACEIQDCQEVSIVRILVSDPYLTCELFLEKGISFHSCDILVVVLQQGATDMKLCLDTLFRAEININSMYSLLPNMQKTMLAIHVPDVDFAASVMNQAGFRTMRQADLSR